MPSRTPIIAGNWKMHNGPRETRRLVDALQEGLKSAAVECQIIVAPPFISLPAAVEAATGTPIEVSAQNVFWEDSGAFTGEVSGPMIAEVGCTHVIIGHSERRQYFHETDDTVNRRLVAAARHGLVPIVCIGETLEEREAGSTFEVVERQIAGCLKEVPVSNPDALILAYEPVWAIGTGVTATPDQAQEVHAFVRAQLASLYSTEVAEQVRILYGGSMKPSNAGNLMACADIDGGLVGGASLKAEDFLGIIRESTR